jgi:hypothetical protein
MSTPKNSAPVSIPAAKAVEESGNKKIGPVSATMTSQASCPRYCPFIDFGCYAMTGPQGWQTAKLNRSTVTDPVAIAKEEAKAIGTLSGSRPLRLHVVGDCTSNETAHIIADAVRQYKRRGHNYGVEPAAWVYTHAWRDIGRRSFGPISTLASCESTAQVRLAQRKGYAAAIVVDRFASEKAYTVDGVKIVPCPQQTGRTENCMSCRLCWDDKRLRQIGVTVGFAAHGNQANSVRKQLIQISLGEKAAA